MQSKTMVHQFSIAPLLFIIDCPPSFSSKLKNKIRRKFSTADDALPNHITFSIVENANKTVNLSKQGVCLFSNLDIPNALNKLIREIEPELLAHYSDHLILKINALAVNETGVLIHSASATDKSALSSALINQGADQFTDDFLIVQPGGQFLQSIESASDIKASLLLIPEFVRHSDLKVGELSSAEAGFQIMACNLNSSNLKTRGLTHSSMLANSLTALKITYGDAFQLEQLADWVRSYLVGNKTDIFVHGLNYLNGAQKPATLPTKANNAKNELEASMPAMTPLKSRKKLCVGMATYDDYDGVYFSVQSLRMFHPEVLDDIEILVLDNNPNGACAQPLKDLDAYIPNYRYIPVADRVGTSIRDLIFEYANADSVLCIDCHVIIEAGAIAKLIGYFEKNQDCCDLLQGPMLDDSLGAVLTHFEPKWSAGMYGTWGRDQRANDSANEPFEIPMQGLGLFACRVDAWPKFNPLFQGFGGEEGYIHEKIRQAGGTNLCLPFLRWLHRFQRPLGVPYPINWEDRIVNYLVGHDELGLDTQPIIDHFEELLNAEAVSRARERWLALYDD